MDRKLAAILALDVVGYSALMEHEQGTFERVKPVARNCSNPRSRATMATSSSVTKIRANVTSAPETYKIVLTLLPEDDAYRLRTDRSDNRRRTFGNSPVTVSDMPNKRLFDVDAAHSLIA
ncbi:hypothetical protein [Mesorhizobium sp. M0296]|uniref:hypothetical protein n=1 Tax=Mesorhizobium sp. M0296 TaxID=2956931 RepID=UPI003338FB0C